MYDPLHDLSPGCNEVYPNSYWADVSGIAPEHDGAVLADIDVDVAIIGAGYTGLSCALHLAREHGIKAYVLEANQTAWGCSGRNAGFILKSSGRKSYNQMAKQWGEEVMRGIYQEMAAGVDTVNGLIDEGIDCLCTLQMVGALRPCTEPPLECGMGYKTCECINEECTEFDLTPCYAACSYDPTLAVDGTCNMIKGIITDEVCNNHDDNCNQEIDENLTKMCYTGDPQTMNVGICIPGMMVCEAGAFGSYYEQPSGEQVFIPDYCDGEILPALIDDCNGEDDNCDGLIDDGKELVDTDILFIIDSSGSMGDEIEAVMIALNQFAESYKDEDVIRWALLMGPFKESFSSDVQYNMLISNLVPFSDFTASFSSIPALGYSNKEAMHDLLYLSLHNLVPFGNLAHQIENLSYNYPGHLFGNEYLLIPDIQNFQIDWRNDSNKVVIIVSDEFMDSHLKMFSDITDWSTIYDEWIEQQDILDIISGTIDLKIYPFSTLGTKTVPDNGFEIYATESGGEWFKLTNNPAEMYENLMTIIGENACQ